MPDWFLDDVEKAAQTHPESFFIPAHEERNNQIVDSQVRLHFVLANPGKGEPQAERMWVTISEVLPFGEGYEGVLDSHPAYIKDIRPGDKVKFKPHHIAQVMIKRTDPRWLDISEKLALVSKSVFEGDKTIRFLYRERPDNEKDSGWRLFSGNETDEYNSDANNIRLCNIGWLLDFDPSLLEVFKSDFGVAFERGSKASQWEHVKDWRPPDD